MSRTRDVVERVVETLEYSAHPVRELGEYFVAPHVGWLRWSPGVDTHGGTYEPPEPFGFAPPLWRLFHAVRWRDRRLWSYMRHDDPGTWRRSYGARARPRRWVCWLADQLVWRWS